MAEGLRQWDSAADHLGKMVSATKGPPSGEDPSLYVRLGTALKHKGDLPGSVEAYERALKRVRGGGGAGTGSPPLTVNRIKALMSEPLYQLGARDAAVTLVMQARAPLRYRSQARSRAPVRIAPSTLFSHIDERCSVEHNARSPNVFM